MRALQDLIVYRQPRNPFRKGTLEHEAYENSFISATKRLCNKPEDPDIPTHLYNKVR